MSVTFALSLAPSATNLRAVVSLAAYGLENQQALCKDKSWSRHDDLEGKTVPRSGDRCSMLYLLQQTCFRDRSTQRFSECQCLCPLKKVVKRQGLSLNFQDP